MPNLIQQLTTLGVHAGDTLVVHTAFSRVGPVAGGPQGLITALQAVLGADGTLVMPSMPDDDEVLFDPATSTCLGMGIVAETFWRQPGVLRSESLHSFAASGPHAARITQPQPEDIPHGPDSPVGRVLGLDGAILLLGVDHTANTTVHLAEYLAGVRYRRAKTALIRRNGAVERLHYGEIDHCCQNFALVDDWLDAARLQRRGTVGHAHARLMRSRDLVTTVTAVLRRNETAFLHAPGIDEQCDEAWQSLAPLGVHAPE